MRRRRINLVKDAEEHAFNATDKRDVLEAKHIDDFKGRGVFALAPFNKGDFVVEYRGELIDFIEAERRREVNRNIVFMFDFLWQNRKWCIDATDENKTLGRLVNDDHITPNCTMKKIVAQERPHLCPFALRYVIPGEDITYDYGPSDWPWRESSMKDDDFMTTTENCSESPVTSTDLLQLTSESSMKDDDFMTTTENCSESPVTSTDLLQLTSEPLVDYTDSEDDVLYSEPMTSYKQMRPAIHEESDDLFKSENSSVSSEDENTDIKDTRQKRTTFGTTEQHQAYSFKSATSTRRELHWTMMWMMLNPVQKSALNYPHNTLHQSALNYPHNTLHMKTMMTTPFLQTQHSKRKKKRRMRVQLYVKADSHC
ncbi:uncharacterized protein LOC130565022 isoform X2 [Triplophysa rosa]|uniref:uncharacterized protein LOC130565022 isoform X2 n=1 Tax=Triplophysa rosa TaxID=992332 RepID=UPI002545DEA8|nr:uncharacterized protein LOC130565022 isoform X2 [Triplophysa rosa]